MNKIILCSSLLILFSCGNKDPKTEMLEQITFNPRIIPSVPLWLQGEWITPSDSVIFSESWSVENDSLMNGRGLAYEGKDTLLRERLAIKRINGTLYYIPTVSNQNNAQPVMFKIIRWDDSGFFAENQAHDFPKTIEYKLIRKDSLCAYLQGTENGQSRSEIFPMKKK